jgi:hypothetical protein
MLSHNHTVSGTIPLIAEKTLFLEKQSVFPIRHLKKADGIANII